MSKSAFVAIIIIGLPLIGCGGGSLLNLQKPTAAQNSILKQFNRIDTDGDKKVSYAETTNWLSQLHKENDANNDGGLEAKEIPDILVTNTLNAGAIVASYDQDADDRLSLAEIAIHANVMFQKDLNADGFLNPGEIKTLISAPTSGGKKHITEDTLEEGVKLGPVIR